MTNAAACVKLAAMQLTEYSIEELRLLLPESLVRAPQMLVDSVAVNGLLVPPVVVDGVVCDGHRRIAACRLAGKPTITCLTCKGSPGVMFAELNSQRELSAFEAAAVFTRLAADDQAAFLKHTGLSESPHMKIALAFIAAEILPHPELLDLSLSMTVWRELGHLGNDMGRFAVPLLQLPGTAAEKRNIAGLLRQAQRRNELPDKLPGNNAGEVLASMQKIAQPRRTEALAHFDAAVAGASLPPTAQLKIDPTFSQPGVQLTINLTRNHLDRLDQAKAAVNEIFAAVPEL